MMPRSVGAVAAAPWHSAQVVSNCSAPRSASPTIESAALAAKTKPVNTAAKPATDTAIRAPVFVESVLLLVDINFIRFAVNKYIGRNQCGFVLASS
jgi:hypothetical protein